ncbi:MAG: aconitase family protein, partial [Saprospiraceae bacterium]
MIFDLKMLREFYKNYPSRVDAAKAKLKRPLTLSEKILYAHLHADSPLQEYKRGQDYVFFQVDRVAMQDATAQMALLQFMTCGRKKVAVPSTVHCDHLITAELGAEKDMDAALDKNREVFDFLSSVSQKYGI